MRFGFQNRKALGPATPSQYEENKEPNTSIVALEPLPLRPTQYHRASSFATKQPLLSQQSLEYQGLNGVETSPPGKPWRPTMLRRWVFAMFALGFLLLIVSLEVVLKISTDRHGFGPTESNLYYIWTYSPTAVFTVVAAFWTQVDYRTRQMQPWEEMAKGPQPATKSLFLDYISSNPAISFLRSLKNRHWPVAVVLLGSLLIKVLIVVSTGLFILNHVVRPQSIPGMMVEEFKVNYFNSSGTDDTAGLIYTGILLGEIDYPPGTNAEYAAELFNSTEPIKANTYTMTANSTTFTADLSCEPATIDPNVTVYCPPESRCTNVYNTMVVHNDNCYMSAFPRDNKTFSVTNNGMGVGSWYGDVLPGTCDGRQDDPDNQRIVVFSLYKDQGSTIKNSTAWFCKPTLRLQQSMITIDQSGDLKKVDNGKQLDVSRNLTALALSEAVLKSVNQVTYSATFIQELAHLYVRDVRQFQCTSIFFGLILKSSGSMTINDLWDADMMHRGVQKIFKSVAVQVAKRYFLLPSSATPDTEQNLTAEYQQERLFARVRSLRAMESLLGVLLAICIYLAVRPQRHTIPQDPASIAGLSSILSQSQGFSSTLISAGFLSSKGLEGLLSGRYGLAYLRSTDMNDGEPPRLVIETHGPNSPRPEHIVGRYWQPLSTLWYVRVALLIVPLSIIVALDIVYRQSKHDDGLLDIATDKWTQYWSSFVPASIMVLTKLLFSATDFDLRIIDPYVQLKRGLAKAKTSVLDKTIYTWKTDAFWTAIMNGRIAVGTSTLSVLVASFLTIAASGLFTTVPIVHHRAVSLTRMDSFFDPTNMTSQFSGIINSSTQIAARLVVYDRMNSPAWTFGQYAIPTLSTPANATRGVDSATLIDAHFPVRRGYLTCELVPQNQVYLNYTTWDNRISTGKNDIGVQVRWAMLDQHNCTSSKTGNKSNGESIVGPADGFFSQWSDHDDLSSEKNVSSCPTSYGVYGTWQGRRAKEVNVVLCWSSVQELNASAQFSMPGWKVQSLVADDSTARNISSGPETQVNMLGNMFGGLLEAQSSSSIDPVFMGFLRNSTSNNDDLYLLQSENFSELYARMQDTYSRITAQIMDQQGRYTNLTTTNTTIAATTTDYATFRLRQNLISTRILQGLLIAMTICALISLFTINPKKVLPKNPCSIAAQASLVAGSLMMDQLQPEAQWMIEKEFIALFEGNRYSMGWSEEVEGQGRFGVDIDMRPGPRKMRRWFDWG